MPTNLNCEIEETLFKEFKAILAIKGESIKFIIYKFVEDYVKKESKKIKK